jgi:hypothetical protein
MKKYVLLFLFTFGIFSSCIKTSVQSEVVIKTDKDTIGINEIYTAKLLVNHTDSVFPVFYIVNKKDTFILPFDENENCGVFKSIGRVEGKKDYKGFVVFINKLEEKMKKDFEISFFVKK